jgi:hypothetical protein
MHIWGWMTNFELEALAEMASSVESVVEVGSLHGRSAFALASSCPGTVHCIDPWDDEHGLCYPSFMGNVGYLPNVRAIRSYNSAEVAAEIGEVDMVFIDGAHDYGAVMADIAAWLPFTGKLMCGHDYENADGGYPGVKMAVDQVFGDSVVVYPRTTIWTVERGTGEWKIESGLPERLTYTDEYKRTDTVDLIWPGGASSL